jgi:eukaryotic-like serine/threonine-protein kinase
VPPTSVSSRESILGYTLIKRLGSGAYGEVWSAEAPGGLSKAIKLIHGYHDEKRAQVELSALNKVKQVRHPFLLSLERIEVVDGQLVVVTELADKSLKDVFDDYRQQRQPGIPREELLGYMRDAADALDFLSQKHGLQHLDVKPENLLLLSGHIKVADFGLVKDLADVTESLLGGMTPAYAPPELFDGRPCSSSDQYSLAIVYQEMLTGERPFTGKTPAQLAAEQMKGRPQLTALPFGDQQVVAKALSKEAKLRYENCRTFVDDLVFRRSRVTQNRHRFVQNVPREAIQGGVGPSGALTDATLRSNDSRLLAAGQAAAVQKLPPWPDFGASNGIDAAMRPVVFVGIGNTATGILRQLRQRFVDPQNAKLLATCVRFLCVDTDRQQLLEATREETHGGMKDAEILPLPLRRPEDYRNDSNLHLNWLSRRWIYNIPRSLQTEGLRPFGRLAFADHAQEVFTRLNTIFSDFGCESNETDAHVACSRASKNNPPRVYIVASSAGGVGSGMVIDAGYAVRTALRELGLADDDVTGILIHSTAPMLRDRSLCVANTFACLNELHHFDKYGFPGDPACGLPPFELGESAFSRVYLLDLGNCAEDAVYQRKLQEIAEYLYLSSITKGSAYFDRSRSEDVVENHSIRSFGISMAGICAEDLHNTWAPYFCRKLIRRWVDPAQNDSGIDYSEFAKQWGDQYAVSVQGFKERLNGTWDKHADENAVRELVSVTLSQAIEDDGSSSFSWSEFPKRILGTLERSTEIGFTGSRSWGAAAVACREAVAHITKEAVEPLRKVVLNLVDEPRSRLSGSIRSLDAALNLVQALQEGLQSNRESLQNEQRELLETWQKTRKPARQRRGRPIPITAEVLGIASITLQTFIIDRGLDIGNRLRSSLCELKHPLTLVRRELVAIADQFPAVEPLIKGKTEESDMSYDQAATMELWKSQDQLLSILDERVQVEFLSNVNGLLHICVDDNSELKKFPDTLAAMAVSVLNAHLRGIPIGEILRNSGMKPAAILDWSRQLAKDAWPPLLRCGGKVRSLLCLPEATEDNAFARLLESQERQLPNTVSATTGPLILTYEAYAIPITAVAFALLQDRPDCIEYASRLHTRVDVEWTKLL